MTVSAGPWSPCSPFEAAGDLIWLPRLIDKGRRKLAGDAEGRDRLGDYMFGDHDYLDGFLLRFLAMGDSHVLAILRAEPDDHAAAMAIVRVSGKTPEQCRAWSASFRRWQWLALVNLDRDEGRLTLGPVGNWLALTVQNAVLPAFRFFYDRRERARPAARSGEPGCVAQANGDTT